MEADCSSARGGGAGPAGGRLLEQEGFSGTSFCVEVPASLFALSLSCREIGKRSSTSPFSAVCGRRSRGTWLPLDGNRGAPFASSSIPTARMPGGPRFLLGLFVMGLEAEGAGTAGVGAEDAEDAEGAAGAEGTDRLWVSGRCLFRGSGSFTRAGGGTSMPLGINPGGRGIDAVPDDVRSDEGGTAGICCEGAGSSLSTDRTRGR